MDDKTKAILQRLDDGTRLIKGEWTSDGKKLFRFLVTEILSKNACTIDEDEKRLISGIRYCLTGKGNPPTFIWIYICAIIDKNDPNKPSHQQWISPIRQGVCRAKR